jgi:hypothetical protein
VATGRNGSIRGIGCAVENDSSLNLVEVEAGRGARVNPWHAVCNVEGGVGFRFDPSAPSRGAGKVGGVEEMGSIAPQNNWREADTPSV